MGGSFSRGIKGSLSGREREPKGFEEIRGEPEDGLEVGKMGGPRGEEEEGTTKEEAMGRAEGGIRLGRGSFGRIFKVFFQARGILLFLYSFPLFF